MKILVTAGPTREAIDPVRFLSNRSSGRMGYALAAAANAAGHETLLVSGPVSLAPPAGVEVVPVISAEDMLAAVRARLGGCDVLVMAAAVADWRPARVSAVKLKKTAMDASLALVRTPDILTSLRAAKGDRLFVGFAAETHSVEAEALRKAQEKGLDLIVANDVGRGDSGFEVDTNRVTIVYPDGRRDAWPLMSKADVARRLMRLIEARRGSGGDGRSTADATG